MDLKRIQEIFDDSQYDFVMMDFDLPRQAVKWVDEHMDWINSFSCSKRGCMGLPRSKLMNAITDWGKTPALTKYEFLTKIVDILKKHSSILSILNSISTDFVVSQSTKDVLPRTIQLFEYCSYLPLSKKERLSRLHSLCAFVNCQSFSTLYDYAKVVAPALSAGSSVCLIMQQNHQFNWAFLFLLKQLSEINLISDLIYIICPKCEDITRDVVECDSKEISVSSYIMNSLKYSSLLDNVGSRYLWPQVCGPSRRCIIVFDSADIDSAANAIVFTLCRFAEKSFPWRFLIQENILASVAQLTLHLIRNLQSGHYLDMVVDLTDDDHFIEECTKNLEPLTKKRATPAAHFRNGDILTFRTLMEASMLANDTEGDLQVSLWTENTSLALEITERLQASLVWINCSDLYDAAVPVGCRRDSLTMNGAECVNCYLQSTNGREKLSFGDFPSCFDTINFDAALSLAQLAELNWSWLKSAQRSHKCLTLLETVTKQKELLTEKLVALSGQKDTSVREVDCLIERLAVVTSLCISGNRTIQVANFSGIVCVTKEPLGLIVILCQDDTPLLTFVSVALLAISCGNVVVALSSSRTFGLLQDFVQILTSAGLPLGILNVIESKRGIIDFPIIKYEVKAIIVMGRDWNLNTMDFEIRKSLCVGHQHLLDYREVDWLNDYDVVCEQLLSDITWTKAVWFTSGVTFAT